MNDIEVTVEAERGPSSTTRRRWPTTVVAVLLVAAAVGAIVWGSAQRDDAAERQAMIDRQRDAVLVASGFVEALMSYEHEDLDAQQSAVESFATEQFRADFVDAFTTDVRDQIVAEKASSTVTVDDVYVTTDDGDELGVIVHALSEVSSEGGATAELESYLRVRLVRLDDRWKVDDLTSLGSRDLSSPLAPPDSEEGESDG
ncbi:hypothetical protein [Actinospongicola halichondriae]|uniref:hypothetical protein n=1 Tax=Actinospongicola halichondriae TaxID=3236844 RepID=UPI003D4632EB